MAYMYRYNPDLEQKNKSDLEDLYAKQRSASSGLGKKAVELRNDQAVDQASSTPMGDAMTGASMGSMFGPYGMAAGAVIGGAAGSINDYQARKKAGQGTVHALLGDLWDSSNPANLFKNGNTEKAARLGAGIHGMAAASAPKYGEGLYDSSGNFAGGSDSDFAKYDPKSGQAYADYWNHADSNVQHGGGGGQQFSFGSTNTQPDAGTTNPNDPRWKFNGNGPQR